MIDSSGRRVLRADGTVFDVLPIGRTIAMAGTLLDALFDANELRVPISRRRWKSVREHYGRGVVHRAATD